MDHWFPPQSVHPSVEDGELKLAFGGDRPFRFNDWSFAQLCRLAGVAKDTLNRLTPPTAARVLDETLPTSDRPVQILTTGDVIRSIHGVAYSRLWDVDLLTMLREFATDFQPPQRAGLVNPNPSMSDDDIPFEPDPTHGTGLYCGEQDMFCFMIDPTGWTEINGEAFAPGFFVWNSEVGRRSVGIQTFWFQAVCANHIVWDAVEVVDFSRKHTANVHEALSEIRTIVANLVEKRDQRRDAFAKVIRKACEETLGPTAEEAMAVLQQQGITKSLAKAALEIARQRGRFTIFAVVDALTRLSAKMAHAGDRAEADEKTGRLLSLTSNENRNTNRGRQLAVAGA
jgi:histone H3/H4